MSSIKINTSHKLSTGELTDFWLSPEDFHSKQDFIDACTELHDDESNPELIFESWVDIPERYISKYRVSGMLWDWLELSESEKSRVQCYWEEVDYASSISYILERFLGEYADEEDWAVNYLDEVGILNRTPQELHPYINYHDFVIDSRKDGYIHFVNTATGVMVFQRT